MGLSFLPFFLQLSIRPSSRPTHNQSIHLLCSVSDGTVEHMGCTFLSSHLPPSFNKLILPQGKNCKSSLGAHSRAEFTTARAAAPSATVRPMTASRTKRRAEGRTATIAPCLASMAGGLCFCCCSRRRRLSTESGRCWVDASSKSLNVDDAVLNKGRQNTAEHWHKQS